MRRESVVLAYAGSVPAVTGDDYFDIVIVPRPSESVENVCRKMHELVEDGQTFYWGTTEWPASMIVAALGACERNNWHKPVLV